MQRGSFGTTGKLIGILAAALVLLARAPIVEAITEAEKTFLSLYFTDEELQVVSATRSLQSIARIAENIEVVTADDIELMNAHTLADVLNTVSGVQVDFTGSFGARAMPNIQGATFERTTVLMNGVPLNNLNSTAAEVGFLPVEDIAKVEIVKGPASAAWGSALGGVINIITKGPGDKPFQGGTYLSYGTEKSADYRAAVSGRMGKLGYYLSGTGLHTDGLTEGFDNNAGYLGARLDYTPSDRTDLIFNLFYGDAPRGDGAYPVDDLLFGNHAKQLVSRLALATDAGRDGRVNVSVWTIKDDFLSYLRLISDGSELFRATVEERRFGGSLSYAWSRQAHALVVGTDYSLGTMRTSHIPGKETEQKQWAAYVNDSINLGALTITPGVRYDDLSTGEPFVSPSLGLTYALSANALVRATVARGFHLPSLVATSGTNEINMFQGNPNLGMEKIWSYQAGVEANIVNAVWLKVSAFRHELEDAFITAPVEGQPDWWTTVNGGRQRRLGVEVAARTRPVHHLTLAGNAFFMKTEDLESDEDLLGVPRRVFDVSLKYDDERAFRALLKGRYYHAAEPEDYLADHGGFIADLNLIRKFQLDAGVTVEVFASVHNLLDQNEFYYYQFPNPGRWYEAGVRTTF